MGITFATCTQSGYARGGVSFFSWTQVPLHPSAVEKYVEKLSKSRFRDGPKSRHLLEALGINEGISQHPVQRYLKSLTNA
ncbi:hypothetical protein PUN28_015017 [Cardiocondyla obscurior]|uniref:Transposase n=1 Tax=Cardiocondyla obscurior TaxID=286306 RepID=A0AAW2F0W3_9HYME